jgi:hypothetical protein
VSATPAFNALKVPPLADATRNFMIPVLFGSMSDGDRTVNRKLLPLALNVLDYQIFA